MTPTITNTSGDNLETTAVTSAELPQSGLSASAQECSVKASSGTASDQSEPPSPMDGPYSLPHDLNGTPSDISADGSPHGPLAFFDEEDIAADAQPSAPAVEGEAGLSSHDEYDDAAAADADGSAPTFATFHSTPPLQETPPSVPAPDDDYDDDDDAEGDTPMSLIGHLNELRRRLFRIVIVAILGFIAFYGVSEPLYAWLSAPLKACMPEGSKLIYTSPQGAFFTYMKVALVASLFGTSPYSFYQVWAFVAPGLYKEEKRAVLPLALFSTVFFLSGAAFCFYLVFPIAFQFFMGFATDAIVPMISVEEYLSFALKLLIAFGLVFEMPLFTFFLSKFGILSPAFMRRSRRYAILLIFVMAAVLTPPDVFSQCMMALPMLLLYEVSIYVSAVARPAPKAPAEESPKETIEKEEA